MASFTTLVAVRILSVSSLRFLTSSMAGSTTVRPPDGVVGASALRMSSIWSGSFGVMRNESGSGLLPSSS
jgi:hypothetical protein